MLANPPTLPGETSEESAADSVKLPFRQRVIIIGYLAVGLWALIGSAILLCVDLL